MPTTLPVRQTERRTAMYRKNTTTRPRTWPNERTSSVATAAHAPSESLSPSTIASSRLKAIPSPTPPRARTAASTPTKAPAKLGYKILMLGSAKVGKTSIIQRFLYDSFCPKYRRTIEELHRADFPIGGTSLTLDIMDTGGSYEFPAMKTLNIASSNAFILVYSIEDESSFDEILVLRNQVVQSKGEAIPLVVVGNKTDLDSRTVDERRAEKIVTKWKHGYVECSAQTGDRVVDVFKELLNQAKVTYSLSPALRKRRQSLPGNGFTSSKIQR
ncbi:Dexamethasone-induced Ras-related protein 1 [Orchesella cincta]|uniref:Dexamethasone-induced Ras-related protein 1 n=1 Tax=Orchesella cincta TaxID=48709 RepID=A0A1D2N4M5_ORCCI|nr:Dexamethasone-induced Ras-related protein 1 [Orchesella cincta]